MSTRNAIVDVSNRVTTGAVRSILFDALKRAQKGQLDHKDGKTMVNISNAMTRNLVAETKAKELQHKLGEESEQARFGNLSLDDQAA